MYGKTSSKFLGTGMMCVLLLVDCWTCWLCFQCSSTHELQSQCWYSKTQVCSCKFPVAFTTLKKPKKILNSVLVAVFLVFDLMLRNHSYWKKEITLTINCLCFAVSYRNNYWIIAQAETYVVFHLKHLQYSYASLSLWNNLHTNLNTAWSCIVECDIFIGPNS